MFIKAAFCTLVRFRCPGCGKTLTDYPAFAIPHKHYTRQSIMGFSAHYLEFDDTTYQQAVMVENCVPGYAKSESSLAPSTFHRWITSLGRFIKSCRTALLLLLQENPLSSICRHFAQILIPQRKFKTDPRKKQLIGSKVRKRWSRDHTHDLWGGDFEDGPYVLENHQVLDTYLSAVIDCHSRYAVEARWRPGETENTVSKMAANHRRNS